jgi:hypothetical protein
MRSEERNYRVETGIASDGTRPMPGGWSYSRDGRRYHLTEEPRPGTGVHGYLEAWVAGRYHAGAGDWTLVAYREDFARLLVDVDLDLRREVRRDLFRFSAAIRLARIEAWLLDLGDDEDDGDDRSVRLLVTGLDAATCRRVAEAAVSLGGRVWEEVE